jgi:hypothetical protein
VVGGKSTDVSEEYMVSIIRVEEFIKQKTSMNQAASKLLQENFHNGPDTLNIALLYDAHFRLDIFVNKRNVELRLWKIQKFL